MKSCPQIASVINQFVSSDEYDNMFLTNYHKADKEIVALLSTHTTLKTVRIAHNVICIYKEDVPNPQEFYTRLWQQRIG